MVTAKIAGPTKNPQEPKRNKPPTIAMKIATV
jgi:hypothetical protein